MFNMRKFSLDHREDTLLVVLLVIFFVLVSYLLVDGFVKPKLSSPTTPPVLADSIGRLAIAPRSKNVSLARMTLNSTLVEAQSSCTDHPQQCNRSHHYVFSSLCSSIFAC